MKVAKANARSTPVYVPSSNARAVPTNANQQAHIPEKAPAEPQASVPAVQSAPESSTTQEEGKYQVWRNRLDMIGCGFIVS